MYYRGKSTLMSSKKQEKILQKKYRMREEIGTREKFDMYFVEFLAVTGGISILEAALSTGPLFIPC